MLNKGSSFAYFVRFRPDSYARTQQSLPPLWAATNFNAESCYDFAIYTFTLVEIY